MFLKALTMKGFKSFADSTTLEFEPGVFLQWDMQIRCYPNQEYRKPRVFFHFRQKVIEISCQRKRMRSSM